MKSRITWLSIAGILAVLAVLLFFRARRGEPQLPASLPARHENQPAIAGQPEVPAPAASPTEDSDLAGILSESSQTVGLDRYAKRLAELSDEDFGPEFVGLLAMRRGMNASIGFNLEESFSTRTGSIYGDAFVRLLLQTWGERAPRSALAFVLDPDLENTEGQRINRYVDVILSGWTHTDSTSAFNWAVEAGRDARSRGSGLIYGVLRTAAVQDELIKNGQFQAAGSLIASGDEYSGSMATALVVAWARSDIMAAAAWVDGLNPPYDPLSTYVDARANAYRGWAEATAIQDLDTVRSLIQQTPGIQNRSALAVGVVNSIRSGLKPLEALNFLSGVMNENGNIPFGGAMRNYTSLTQGMVRSGSDDAAQESAIVATIVNPELRAQFQAMLASRPDSAR